ncbi:MAG: long-chain fatty acid--CoA ligase, partial [Lachnospiraceae bacterium]|nr:long-chain fatty acid--CoA ligase [Lachnospiraceae bacterium]
KYVGQIPKSLMKKYVSRYTDEEALILYSSGTTGKNKGIILTYKAINLNADAILKYMKLEYDDSIYIVKTLSHSSTIVGELLVALKAGCSLFLASTIVPPKFTLDNIQKYGITTLCLNPALLQIYCRAGKNKLYSFSRLKAIYTSGSILEKEVLDEAKKCFNNIPILNVYGLTEAGPRVAAQTLNDINIAESVGKAIEGVEIKIVKNVVDSDMGIVFVRSPMLFSGYVSGKSNNVEEDEWLNTGDIGYIDSEGNLFIVGRYDNMMSIGAHNVFPEAIEQRILQSGLVKDCIVYSIRNKIQGEEIICEYIADSEIGPILFEYCSKFLAPYEIPKIFQKTEEIQCTYNGKKKRGNYGN